MSPAVRPQDTSLLRHWNGPGHVHVVVASGELDLRAAPELRDLLVRLIELGRNRLVVDLSDVTFIDSTTIGVLAGRQRQLHADRGELVLVCSNPNLLRTIDISGMGRVIDVHPTLSGALAGFGVTG
jgi:anti-sigma B factor antagonist